MATTSIPKEKKGGGWAGVFKNKRAQAGQKMPHHLTIHEKYVCMAKEVRMYGQGNGLGIPQQTHLYEPTAPMIPPLPPPFPTANLVRGSSELGRRDRGHLLPQKTRPTACSKLLCSRTAGPSNPRQTRHLQQQGFVLAAR